MNEQLRRLRQLLKVINYFCITQFVVVLVYIQLFERPVTKIHMLIVALSGVFGLLVTGAARRRYAVVRERLNSQEQQRNLDEALHKIKDNDKTGKKT